MTRRLPMPGLALRLLLAVACVLPFTGVASAAAVLTVATGGNTAPAGEEDEREEEEAGEERAAQERHDRHADPLATSSLLPVLRSVRPSRAGPSRPTAADPFRNGLGTPFRC